MNMYGSKGKIISVLIHVDFIHVIVLIMMRLMMTTTIMAM